MARRTSVFEDLMELTAKLPWWIGVVFAVVSYIALHAMAGRELPPTKMPGDAIGAALIKGFASVGQYVFPIAFGGGALMSAIQRFRRRRVLQGEGRSQTFVAPCPSCGSNMVRRVARKGANAGSEFWGCAMYPKCKGTRPISA